MRVISQDGNLECEYSDLGLSIIGNSINGFYSKVNDGKSYTLATYDCESDVAAEIRMLHNTYVKLNSNPGCYQFTSKETYRKSRGELW
jgi:hypothetical protein